MSNIIIDEIGMLELVQGPIAAYVFDVAGDVANRAIDHASGRPGPNVITGDLIKGIRTEPGEDHNGPFVDVASIAEHGGVNYPSLLEQGFVHRGREGGREVRYQWLVPALRDIFGNEVIENPS